MSSCVTKATEVVRRLPRADVALPMPFLGDHGKKKKKKALCVCMQTGRRVAQ